MDSRNGMTPRLLAVANKELASKKRDAAAREARAEEMSRVKMFRHAFKHFTRTLDVDQGRLAMLMATIIFTGRNIVKKMHLCRTA
jgi:hypothetical protein